MGLTGVPVSNTVSPANPTLDALRASLDKLRSLPVYQKATTAEQCLQTMAAIMTDFDNRLRRLERGRS